MSEKDCMWDVFSVLGKVESYYTIGCDGGMVVRIGRRVSNLMFCLIDLLIW